MPDVSDLIAEIDDHGFEDAETARKAGVINDTLQDICSREPWPFLEDSVTLTFDGITAYPSNWPADFSKVLSIIDLSTGVKLAPERREVMRQSLTRSLADGGLPTIYYFLGTRASFYPVPSEDYELAMDYLVSHPTITDTSVEADILLPARHHRALVLGALYKLYALEDDPELSALFKQEYEDKLLVMREDLSRLQYDRPDRIFILSDDDYDTY